MQKIHILSTAWHGVVALDRNDSFLWLGKVTFFEFKVRPTSHKIFLHTLGLIHTGHFDAQYCDIAIKRYCDKKIFLSHGLQD